MLATVHSPVEELVPRFDDTAWLKNVVFTVSLVRFVVASLALAVIWVLELDVGQ